MNFNPILWNPLCGPPPDEKLWPNRDTQQSQAISRVHEPPALSYLVAGEQPGLFSAGCVGNCVTPGDAILPGRPDRVLPFAAMSRRMRPALTYAGAPKRARPISPAT